MATITKKELPSEENLRSAMALAWRDHHHARDQTWKALQMVAVLGAGLITVDIQYTNFLATLGAGVLVILAASFGIAITRRHRSLERRKFIHIMNCEDMLGLHRDDVIPLMDDQKGKEDISDEILDGAVSIPNKFSVWNIFRFDKHNTSLFIMRLHLALILFSLLFIGARYLAA